MLGAMVVRATARWWLVSVFWAAVVMGDASAVHAQAQVQLQTHAAAARSATGLEYTDLPKPAPKPRPSKAANGPLARNDAPVATTPATGNRVKPAAAAAASKPAATATAGKTAAPAASGTTGKTAAPAASGTAGKPAAPAAAGTAVPATTPSATAAKTAGSPTAEAKAQPAAPAPAPAIAVKGLTGTLNRDDVHQRMAAQQREFDACIARNRRTVGWVSGALRFAFKVDASGAVLDARPVEATVGHRELEQCLTDAVSAVVFPKPAGRGSAQFGWTVLVDPAGQPPDPLDPKPLSKLLRKQRKLIARSCELRPRERFMLTAYVAPTGKVLSAGGFALRGRGADKLDCVLEAVGELHLPKVPRRSKLTFKF